VCIFRLSIEQNIIKKQFILYLYAGAHFNDIRTPLKKSWLRAWSRGVHGDGDGGKPAGVGINVAGIPRGWI